MLGGVGVGIVITVKIIVVKVYAQVVVVNGRRWCNVLIEGVVGLQLGRQVAIERRGCSYFGML